MTIDECKQRVVTAHADACARMEFRSALADNDVARDNGFAAITLHAEILWI